MNRYLWRCSPHSSSSYSFYYYTFLLLSILFISVVARQEIVVSFEVRCWTRIVGAFHANHFPYAFSAAPCIAKLSRHSVLLFSTSSGNRAHWQRGRQPNARIKMENIVRRHTILALLSEIVRRTSGPQWQRNWYIQYISKTSVQSQHLFLCLQTRCENKSYVRWALACLCRVIRTTTICECIYYWNYSMV